MSAGLTGEAGAREGGGALQAALPLPVGRSVFDAGHGVEFWRLSLAKGSLINVQAQALTATPLAICILSPKATAHGLRTELACAAQGGTYRASRIVNLKLPVPAAGEWHFALGEQSTGTRLYPGCIGIHYPGRHEATFRSVLGICDYPFDYRLSVSVTARQTHPHGHRSHPHKKRSRSK